MVYEVDVTGRSNGKPCGHRTWRIRNPRNLAKALNARALAEMATRDLSVVKIENISAIVGENRLASNLRIPDGASKHYFRVK